MREYLSRFRSAIRVLFGKDVDRKRVLGTQSVKANQQRASGQIQVYIDALYTEDEEQDEISAGRDDAC